MTKDELIAALQDVPGDTEVCVELGYGPVVEIVDVAHDPAGPLATLLPPCELSLAKGVNLPRGVEQMAIIRREHLPADYVPGAS
jgi:hypothetical protein